MPTKKAVNCSFGNVCNICWYTNGAFQTLLCVSTVAVHVFLCSQMDFIQFSKCHYLSSVALRTVQQKPA